MCIFNLAPFVEKLVYFIVLLLCFVKDQLTVFMWIYFWAISSTDLLSILSSILWCPNYCNFYSESEIELMSVLQLVFQYCIGYFGSFAFSCVESVYQYSHTKKCWNFDSECFEYVDEVGTFWWWYWQLIFEVGKILHLLSSLILFIQVLFLPHIDLLHF